MAYTGSMPFFHIAKTQGADYRRVLMAAEMSDVIVGVYGIEYAKLRSPRFGLPRDVVNMVLEAVANEQARRLEIEDEERRRIGIPVRLPNLVEDDELWATSGGDEP